MQNDVLALVQVLCPVITIYAWSRGGLGLVWMLSWSVVNVHCCAPE